MDAVKHRIWHSVLSRRWNSFSQCVCQFILLQCFNWINWETFEGETVKYFVYKHALAKHSSASFVLSNLYGVNFRHTLYLTFHIKILFFFPLLIEYYFLFCIALSKDVKILI